MEINESWLDLTKENVIDPDLPICDCHHHLWDNPGSTYMLEEFFKDISGGHNILKTVFIESASVNQVMQPLEETRFIHDLTDPANTAPFGKTEVAAGIVGFVDLTLGDKTIPIIESHLDISDRFRGIRQTASWDADERVFSPGLKELLIRPDFRKGFECLKDYELSFETFLYHPQIPELADLAKSYPDIPVILDHIGGPLLTGGYAGKGEEVFNDWKKSIKELSGFDNVFMKLGGLGMPINDFNWGSYPKPLNSSEMAEIMKPWFMWCIEHFGVERCMFESNFPVEKMSFSYTVLWNAFKRISEDFSPDERRALFYDTAVMVYRL